jgi:hypothetical protein
MVNAGYGSGESIIFGISARAIRGQQWCLFMDLEQTGIRSNLVIFLEALHRV